MNHSSGSAPGEEMETKSIQATDILFCKKGGSLKCCFSNVKCVENYEFINDEVREGKGTSKIHLQNKVFGLN